MWKYNKPKGPSLTHQEKNCFAAIEDRQNYFLRIRKTSLKSDGMYCLFDASGNPIAQWPRGVIEGLIIKNKLQLDKATGVFKTI